MKESIILRIILIVAVIFVLLIPLLMISFVISDRQNYRNAATAEIYKSWADHQIVTGPILTLENRIRSRDKEGNITERLNYRHYLPDSLIVNCELVPEIRYRGIYEVVLYNAKIHIEGTMANADFTKSDNDPDDIKDYYLSYDIKDLRGIGGDVSLKWNGAPCEVSSGSKFIDIFQSGFNTPINLKDRKAKYDFEADFLLRGSEDIEFLPLGRNSDITIKSEWNNPSFFGAFLPTSRNISSHGFSANWQVNHFNRDYPQVWERQYEIGPSAFGVKLMMPVDEYQKTMRTSKYGLIIIILTFVSFFMIEIFSKKTIHPIQYLLVGFSLVIFYSLLLSISEYLVFQYSYLVSSLMTISMTGLYVKSIYSSARLGALIGVILAILYGFMYVILQLQDYSLLLGNIALFAILAIIMYLTRKLNWYEVLKTDPLSKS